MYRLLVFSLLLYVSTPSSALICDRRPNFEQACAGCDGLTVAWAWAKDGIWCIDCMGRYCPPLYAQEKTLAQTNLTMTCDGREVDIPEGFVTAISIDRKQLQSLSHINPYIGSRLKAFIPTDDVVAPLAFPGTARTVWMIDESSQLPVSEESSIRLPSGEYIEVTGEMISISEHVLQVVFATRHYFPSGDALLVGSRVSLELTKAENSTNQVRVSEFADKHATLYQISGVTIIP